MRLLVLIVSLFAFTSSADARVIAECFGMKGASIYVGEREVVADGSASVRFRLLESEGQFDLQYSVGDQMHSAAADGATIIGHRYSPRLLVTLVAYPNMAGIEAYTFDYTSNSMSLAQARTGGIIPKSGVFWSECKFLD